MSDVLRIKEIFGITELKDLEVKVKFGMYSKENEDDGNVNALLRRNLAMLFHFLNSGTLVGFIGSGCSKQLDYPTWKEFVVSILNSTAKNLKDRNPKDKVLIKRMNGFAAKVKNDAGVETNLLMFYLGLCQKALFSFEDKKSGHEANGEMTLYQKQVYELFSGTERRNLREERNPYRNLMKLPI